MKEIAYANEKIVTASTVADAVMQYAASLGASADADTVDIPVVTADGTVGTMELLIGPASQLISQPIESEFPDPDGAALVAELGERMRRRGPLAAVPSVGAPEPLEPDYSMDLD